jgi:biotin carboxyl carrier protein
MPLQLKIDDQTSHVQLLNQNGSKIVVAIDNREYNLDVERVGKGIYSILYKNRSYNVELIQGNHSRQYLVNTQYRTFDIEIIDAQARYKMSRNKDAGIDSHNVIVSPMPGRVVRVLTHAGDLVEKGQTLIVLSAMKMESEYKAGTSGTIKTINVNPGDTVDGGQILIVIESNEVKE